MHRAEAATYRHASKRIMMSTSVSQSLIVENSLAELKISEEAARADGCSRLLWRRGRGRGLVVASSGAATRY